MSEITNKQAEQLFGAIGLMEKQLAQIKEVLQQAGLSAEVGIVGVFEGDVMVTAEGEQHPVPANYASKTMLVSGDTLRLAAAPGGGPGRFKQIGKVERSKGEGLLVKKDGKFEVLTEEGAFKILSAAAKFHELEPGDTVLIQYAKQHNRGSWAAVEKVVVRADKAATKPVATQPVVAAEPAVVAAPMPVVSAMPSLVGGREKIVKEQPVETVQKPVADDDKADDKVEVVKTESSAKKAEPKPRRKPAEKKAGPARPKAPAKPASSSRTRSESKPRVESKSADLPADQGEIVPEVVEFEDDDLL